MKVELNKHSILAVEGVGFAVTIWGSVIVIFGAIQRLPISRRLRGGISLVIVAGLKLQDSEDPFVLDWNSKELSERKEHNWHPNGRKVQIAA